MLPTAVLAIISQTNMEVVVTLLTLAGMRLGLKKVSFQILGLIRDNQNTESTFHENYKIFKCFPYFDGMSTPNILFTSYFTFFLN